VFPANDVPLALPGLAVGSVVSMISRKSLVGR